MAQINREWSHSQGTGEPPLARKFARPEVMIHVKCNIHSWMQAYMVSWIILISPCLGKTAATASETCPYTVAIWQEKLGTQEQQVTVAPHSNSQADDNTVAATIPAGTGPWGVIVVPR